MNYEVNFLSSFFIDLLMFIMLSSLSQNLTNKEEKHDSSGAFFIVPECLITIIEMVILIQWKEIQNWDAIVKVCYLLLYSIAHLKPFRFHNT